MRRTAIAGAAGLALFALLCANEVVGMPPLMTPAFHPPTALQGTWRGMPVTSNPSAVVFTLHRDGSVTGSIGDATVTTGRIVFNRSWFGKWMHWRSEYMIRGGLSKPARISAYVNGSRFSVPFTLRDDQFRGSIFFGYRPVNLTLRLDPASHSNVESGIE